MPRDFMEHRAGCSGEVPATGRQSIANGKLGWRMQRASNMPPGEADKLKSRDFCTPFACLDRNDQNQRIQKPR